MMETRRRDRQESQGSPGLLERYRQVRTFTEDLAASLSPEDCSIQTMPDVSPTRWHLAHTTWFFETFALAPSLAHYVRFHPQFGYLFNSYYNAIGVQFPRPQRGLLSRPSQREVLDYRAYVDNHMTGLLAESPNLNQQIQNIIELGLNHEQQHQELVLTDIKHVLSYNPLYPVYRHLPAGGDGAVPPFRWVSYDEGIRWLGNDGQEFCFDNETPRHRVFLEAFELADRLVTNAEYLEFMRDGGYREPGLWMSEGWQEVTAESWCAPLYWVDKGDEDWHAFSLGGLEPLNPAAPVCHVSYFEADAFARWAGARLATEAEWEVAAAGAPRSGNFVESGPLGPQPVVASPAGGGLSQLRQMFGDVWEWTSSSYAPYPGYESAEGALGEYNGKFMCNQYVLRGGSCVTSENHMRPTYRNFFPAKTRWQFAGIRLAR